MAKTKEEAPKNEALKDEDKVTTVDTPKNEDIPKDDKPKAPKKAKTVKMHKGSVYADICAKPECIEQAKAEGYVEAE